LYYVIFDVRYSQLNIWTAFWFSTKCRICVVFIRLFTIAVLYQ